MPGLEEIHANYLAEKLELTKVGTVEVLLTEILRKRFLNMQRTRRSICLSWVHTAGRVLSDC